MEDQQDSLGSFMMESQNNQSSDNSLDKSDKKIDKNEKKELTEEEKELLEAKKESKAQASKYGNALNPAMMRQQTTKLIFVYSLVGLLLVGFLIFQKQNPDFFSKGLNKIFNSIMFGGR